MSVAVLGFGNTLTFFEDDMFGFETGLGIVSEIKIYDGPIVPSPTGTPPVTSNVVPNPNPASVNELIVVTATITDTGVDASDITAAEFEVRDMETSAVVLSGLGNDASCPDPYEPCAVNAPFDDETEDVEFTIPAGALSSGVYDVCVRGTDTDPSTGDFECAFLVIYDPDGGFVSGGGWIQSDPGFCSLNPLCAGADGKAHFGFVSKYKKGANVPTGQTRFDFKAGDFEFKATEYDWLVVGGPQGKFKGSGTINGSGDYGFMLTAKDSSANGGPSDDQFRIKIWDNGTETIVYDNGSNQPVGGGSIVIH